MTGCGEIDPVTLEQLEELARSRPRFGAGGAGEGVGDPDAGTVGSEWTPAEVASVPPGWYLPNQAAFEELDRAHLEEHPEVRQRMWEIWHGY